MNKLIGSKAWRRIIDMAALSLSILSLLGTASIGHATTLSGSVEDAAGVPIDGIRVEVWDEGEFLDVLLDVVYTVGGTFSSTAPEPGHDVFVRVKWELQLLPSDFYNGRVVRILDEGHGDDPYVVDVAYEEEVSDVVDDIEGETVTLPTIRMGQEQPVGLATLVLRIQQPLDYLRVNKADVGWSLDDDIPVHIITDSSARHFQGEVFIETTSFDGTGPVFDTITLFHEIAHLIHFRHNGDEMPLTLGSCEEHTINTEEDPGCALVEGYATYIAQLVAEQLGLTHPVYRAYRDDGAGLRFPAKSLWRGDEGGNGSASASHSGLDAGLGRFESGDVVEGAFAGFLFSVSDAFGFATSFAAMHDHDPDTPFEVLEGLVADVGGSDTPTALQIYALMQSHGIVYSRAIFADEPFAEPEPANTASMVPGNQKLINGHTFVRGTVTARVGSASGLIDLGVGPDHVAALARAKVGYKRAFAGTSDSATIFSSFTELVDFGFFSDEAEIEVDTRTLDVVSSDGKWDFIVVGENEDGFVDNLLPNWFGDGNSSVDSDERYLKKLGAWFDGDGVATTESDGMVMVDNTAPVVTTFAPQ